MKSSPVPGGKPIRVFAKNQIWVFCQKDRSGAVGVIKHYLCPLDTTLTLYICGRAAALLFETSPAFRGENRRQGPPCLSLSRSVRLSIFVDSAPERLSPRGEEGAQRRVRDRSARRVFSAPGMKISRRDAKK